MRPKTKKQKQQNSSKNVALQKAKIFAGIKKELKKQGQQVDPRVFYDSVKTHIKNIQHLKHVLWAIHSLAKEDILATPMSVANRLHDFYANRVPMKIVDAPMGGSPSGRSRRG